MLLHQQRKTIHKYTLFHVTSFISQQMIDDTSDGHFTKEVARTLLYYAHIDLDECDFDIICFNSIRPTGNTLFLEKGTMQIDTMEMDNEFCDNPDDSETTIRMSRRGFLDFDMWSFGVITQYRQSLLTGLLAEKRGQVPPSFLDSQMIALTRYSNNYIHIL